MNFVNAVREAQGYEPIDSLPAAESAETSIELAMGCRIEGGAIRLASAERAVEVSSATDLPLGTDGVTVALPPALEPMVQTPPAAGGWALHYGPLN